MALGIDTAMLAAPKKLIDSCGSPVMAMLICMRARLSRLSVSIFMPRIDTFSSANAALTSRTRPRRSKA